MSLIAHAGQVRTDGFGLRLGHWHWGAHWSMVKIFTASENLEVDENKHIDRTYITKDP